MRVMYKSGTPFTALKQINGASLHVMHLNDYPQATGGGLGAPGGPLTSAGQKWAFRRAGAGHNDRVP